MACCLIFYFAGMSVCQFYFHALIKRFFRELLQILDVIRFIVRLFKVS